MSTRSKVEKFIDALRNRILSGEFGSGERLPSFRTLATEYGTTQETMNKTIQALQAEGLLTSKGSKGVFVSSPNPRLHYFRPNFFKYLKEQDPEAIEEYIETPTIVNAPLEMIRELGLKRNAKAIRRFKRQRIGNIVFRLEEIYYPESLLTNGMKKRIMDDSSYIPISDIKRNFNTIISHISNNIVSRLPTAYEQEILKIVRTNPVIDIKRAFFSKNRKVGVAYQRLVCNANLFYFSYELEIDEWK